MFAPLFSRRRRAAADSGRDEEAGKRQKREERISFRDGDTKRMGEVGGMEENA